MNGPSSIQKRDSVGPTDMAPVSKRTYQSPTVKVQLTSSYAYITSKDGAIDERVPLDRVIKRFRKGESMGFFRAVIKSGIEVLEIAERVPDPDPLW